MKIRKRWISLCLAIILLAGIAFNPGSIAGNYVEAANLEETGEAVSEENVQPDNTAAVLSETDTASAQTESTETVMTDTPAEDTTATETPVEETQIETPVETPAPETTETSTPAEPTENVETTTDTEQAVTEQPTTPVPEAPIENTDENTTQEIPAELKSLSFENDEVIITVSEMTAGAIPEGATLKVVPILADNKETEAQYKEVEKQLQDKAAEKASEVVDFLAYDISFVDVNGNEVEPDSEVKVSMEYKNPVLPETDNTAEAGDLEVSVLHLEEDEYGNVKEVVDMGEANKIETLELGTEQQVKKVELTTDSFSVYTITYDKSHKLKIQVVDASGNDLGYRNAEEDNYKWDDQSTNAVATIANDIKRKLDLNLDFNKAVYVEEGKTFSYTAQQIYGFKFKDNDFWKCKSPDIQGTSGWGAVGAGTVYFIFGDEPELTFSPIKTVSTRNTIDINLFDYQVGADGDEEAGWDSSEGINAGHALKFVDTKGSDNQTININQSGSSGKINSGMVKNQLSDGYPVLSRNKQGSNGESLSYLFDSSAQSNVKSVYSNLDLLFKLDDDGYHVFNSDENYAYLKNDGNGFASDFTVGNISGQNSPGFYPFSQPTSSTISDIKHSSDDAKLGSTGVNHYYGMTIETSFIQPKGGKINNQNMIFEFSGDDDVWVFIDDVLVLDLGGIHGKVSGTINFATGEVTRTDINGGYATGTTIREAFEAAGVAADLEPGKNTFSDYSTHTIKFFYLERGNFDSNCMIKFNFPTIPKDSVSVAKEVTNEAGEGLDYADDIDFEFNIKVDGANYANREYSLWENGKQVVDEFEQPVTGKTYDNGNFTLKHNQMAVFSGIDADSHYQVSELGAYLDGYKVTVDNIEIKVNPDEIDGETIYSATTGDRVVGTDSSVVFKNAIDKIATLNITKELAAGEASTEKEFQILVKIQGEPYNGTYSVGGRDGLTTENGIIFLKAGETATITGIPYGVSFEVEEILDGSYLPTYSASGDGIYDVVVPTEENGLNTVTGKLNGDGGTVTVTNSEINIEDGKTDVTVTKTWDDDGKYSELIPESIVVTLYEDVNHNQQYDEGTDEIVRKDALGNAIQAEATLSKDNDWTHTWSNLPADTDFVITETYPEGFEWKTTTYSNDLSNLKYLYRTTSCSNQKFNLGKNNMLLVKKTKNTGYFLWSVYDLNLSSDEIREIAQAIKDMNLEGDGNLDLDNLEYKWGVTGAGENINLTPTETGWNLEFEKTSVWSQFWNLQYDRTENIHLVNQIDKDLKTKVTVNKEWGNYTGDSVTVELIPTVDEGTILNEEKIQWDGDFTAILNKSNGWTHTYENLPFYYYDSADNKYKEITYSVTETEVTVNGETVKLSDGVVSSDGYVFNVTSNKNNFTITNNKISEWEIVKVSSTGNEIRLEGAEFTLTKQGEQTPKYYGKSDSNGIVKWYDNPAMTGEPKTFIDDGVYSLEEIKAPEGYQKSGEIWNLTIENYQLKKIINSDDENINTMPNVNGKFSYAYVNEVLYALPESGGTGIYWYTIGGMLLMMAGSLILYKNKRGEVLERK